MKVEVRMVSSGQVEETKREAWREVQNATTNNQPNNQGDIGIVEKKGLVGQHKAHSRPLESSVLMKTSLLVVEKGGKASLTPKSVYEPPR